MNMTAPLTRDESRRIERVAMISAITAAAIAPLFAVPLAFAASARVLPLLGLSFGAPALAWRMAIGGLAATWAVFWTARHAPAMVRARLPQAASQDRR